MLYLNNSEASEESLTMPLIGGLHDKESPRISRLQSAALITSCDVPSRGTWYWKNCLSGLKISPADAAADSIRNPKA